MPVFNLIKYIDTLHCVRDTIQSDHEENVAFKVPGANYGNYPDAQRK